MVFYLFINNEIKSEIDWDNPNKIEIFIYKIIYTYYDLLKTNNDIHKINKRELQNAFELVDHNVIFEADYFDFISFLISNNDINKIPPIITEILSLIKDDYLNFLFKLTNQLKTNNQNSIKFFS